jgi:methyltransferase (TIGR00027 family)
LVAWYRALESECPDAHFHDPYTRLLTGQRGQDIVRCLPWSTWISWTVVVRTCVFDELIRHLVEQEGMGLVLNLGAGFDTCPYRLTLPARTRWIEVDLPEVLADKEEKLAHTPSVCALERVKLDLTENEARNALFRHLNAEARKL